MYYFFSIAFLLCTITIGSILHRYAEKSTPWHVRIVVFYAWLCAVIIICLVPLDIWAVRAPASPSRASDSLLLGPGGEDVGEVSS